MFLFFQVLAARFNFYYFLFLILSILILISIITIRFDIHNLLICFKNLKFNFRNCVFIDKFNLIINLYFLKIWFHFLKSTAFIFQYDYAILAFLIIRFYFLNLDHLKEMHSHFNFYEQEFIFHPFYFSVLDFHRIFILHNFKVTHNYYSFNFINLKSIIFFTSPQFFVAVIRLNFLSLITIFEFKLPFKNFKGFFTKIDYLS